MADSTKARRKRKEKVVLTVRTIAAWLITFIFISPFLYLILCSFKSKLDLQAYPPKLLFTPTLENYVQIFEDVNILVYVKNSLIIATSVTLVSLLIGLPAAYAISRFDFRGRNTIANAFLVIQLAPAAALILPFFLLANRLMLYDTKFGVFLAYLPINIPYAIWMLRGFIVATPAAIEEAGMVDGCSRFGAFMRLTVPQLGSGLLATIIFTFISAWNEFLLAYFLTGSENAKTLPTMVDFFLTYGNYQFGPMFASAVIATLPIVLFSFIVRKYYLTALTGGAVKG